MVIFCALYMFMAFQTKSQNRTILLSRNEDVFVIKHKEIYGTAAYKQTVQIVKRKL